MKQSHKEILVKIEKYLSSPGVEHLRFWQALRNCNIICYEEKSNSHEVPNVKDDYNISDNELLKRIKS